MKRMIFCISLMIAISHLSSAPFFTPEDSSSTVYTVAILDFQSNGISAPEGRGLTERFRAELFKTGRFEILERDQMNLILSEMEFQMSGCTSDACAVQVGRLVGVQKMIAGSITKLGHIFSVTIRLIDVETGKIDKIVNKDIRGDISQVLMIGMPALARELAGLSSEGSTAMYKITTTPKNANIFIDNIFMGKSPLTIRLTIGKKYSLRVERRGYKIFQDELLPMSDKGETLNIPLSPRNSYLNYPQARLVSGFRMLATLQEKSTPLNYKLITWLKVLTQYYSREVFLLDISDFKFDRIQYMDGFEISYTDNSDKNFIVYLGLSALRNRMEIWAQEQLSLLDNNKYYTLSIWFPGANMGWLFLPYPNRIINPYIGGGISYKMLIVNLYTHHLSTRNIKGPTYTGFSYNLEAGIQVFLFRRLSVDLIYQYQVNKLELNKDFNQVNRRIYNSPPGENMKKLDLSGNYFSAGLHFYY